MSKCQLDKGLSQDQISQTDRRHSSSSERTHINNLKETISNKTFKIELKKCELIQGKESFVKANEVKVFDQSYLKGLKQKYDKKSESLAKSLSTHRISNPSVTFNELGRSREGKNFKSNPTSRERTQGNSCRVSLEGDIQRINTAISQIKKYDQQKKKHIFECNIPKEVRLSNQTRKNDPYYSQEITIETFSSSPPQQTETCKAPSEKKMAELLRQIRDFTDAAESSMLEDFKHQVSQILANATERVGPFQYQSLKSGRERLTLKSLREL